METTLWNGIPFKAALKVLGRIKVEFTLEGVPSDAVCIGPFSGWSTSHVHTAPGPDGLNLNKFFSGGQVCPCVQLHSHEEE